jgi:VCBS repeat-containing protein
LAEQVDWSGENGTLMVNEEGQWNIAKNREEVAVLIDGLND